MDIGASDKTYIVRVKTKFCNKDFIKLQYIIINNDNVLNADLAGVNPKSLIVHVFTASLRPDSAWKSANSTLVWVLLCGQFAES